jgi:hypothetical protein
MNSAKQRKRAMNPITSFEVLSQPVAPGIPDVPYVTQGFFLQISNLGTNPSKVDVLFTATPAFVKVSAGVSLFTNVINAAGTITQYPVTTFLTAPVGIKAQTIAPGATFLFGVQYILAPGTSEATIASTPQDAIGARGTVALNATAGSLLALLATTRQVFTNYTPLGQVQDVTEAAYVVPIFNGPIFEA